MTTSPSQSERSEKGNRYKVEEAAGLSLWADAMRRIRRDWVAVLCLFVIGLYVLIALGGLVYEILADHYESIPRFSETVNYAQSNLPPSADHWTLWLGTDWAGKSVLVKTLLGAKVSITVAFMANIIAVPLGMILGAIAGYYGKRTDAFIVWLFTTLSSIPGIILLIALKYAFKGIHLGPVDLSGIHGLYLALGIISWVNTCRLVRAEVFKIRELDYVQAARAIGVSNHRILVRHVLPNVSHLAIINFSLGFVGAITAEVILSYLGLGVAVGTPSWGSMINAARMDLFIGRWWELTSAVMAMFFLILALNLFGDRLRDALDPRLKNVS
ncbi:MAG: ABC transporter permease [Phycisphaerae bacterium]|nr:ABC transporter permease [Phycisphaerae bacterium]